MEEYDNLIVGVHEDWRDISMCPAYLTFEGESLFI